MKKIFFSIIAVLTFITAASAQQKELMDKVMARVGDEYILLSDIEEQFSAAKEQRGDKVPPQYRCVVLDQAMVAKLLVNQAKIDSLYPKDEEVESQLTARVEKILDYMGGNVDQFVAYYGMAPDAMKEQMRDDMRDQIMGEKMRSKVLADVTVTPSEVKKFFATIPVDSLPYFNQEVEISEIVHNPKPNAVQKKLAKDKLDDIREKVVSGKETFENMAKKFSQDPGSGREGGDLGWAKRGKFVPAFEAAAYKLEPGQISPVVESDFGFHVIQLIERRGNSIHCRHILVKPEVIDEDNALAKHTLDSIRREVLRDSMTFSKAVKDYGDKNTQSYHNDGRMTNPATGTTIFETRDLDPDTYFAIDTMKVNGLSPAIEVALPTGEKYYRVVKLLSKTSPHKANLLQDYNKIQQATIEQKKSGALVKWITQKSQITFVKIDPRYNSCPNLEKWATKAKP